MELDLITLLQNAGPLTLSAIILVAGMRLGRLWSKVEGLLAGQEDIAARLSAIERRLADLESRHGE